jgi:protein arginine kinase activator
MGGNSTSTVDIFRCVMQCQRCDSQATVHLTEVVKQPDGARGLREIHLCLPHAIEHGVVSTGMSHIAEPEMESETAAADTGLPLAIVPSQPVEKGLALTKPNKSGEPNRCPACGTTWQDFRRTGLMGCPADYAFFQSRLLPLLKRAQEQYSSHVGKAPGARVDPLQSRAIETLALQRELERALAQEDYKNAARVRDKLRALGEQA